MGFQFLATFQFPPAVLVHVMLVALQTMDPAINKRRLKMQSQARMIGKNPPNLTAKPPAGTPLLVVTDIKTHNTLQLGNLNHPIRLNSSGLSRNVNRFLMTYFGHRHSHSGHKKNTNFTFASGAPQKHASQRSL